MSNENEQVGIPSAQEMSETADTPITGAEMLEVREDIFKSGFAQKVEESDVEYRDRVQKAWEQERDTFSQESEQDGISQERPIIAEDVKKWLSHPLTESYAQRYLQGEKIDDLLQGQEHIPEKTEAIQLLAAHLRPENIDLETTEGSIQDIEQEERVVESLSDEKAEESQNENTIADSSPEENTLESQEEGLQEPSDESQEAILNEPTTLSAYEQAEQYIEKIKKKSSHPELLEQYLEDWKDPANIDSLHEFLLNSRYKEYREVDYPIEPNYESVFEYANTDDSQPHINQNGWVYRGILPTHEMHTKTRGSLNIHITEESIHELDTLIANGIFVGNYKFGEPNTPADASERHDAVTLYFLEEPTEEAQTALAGIAQKYHRGGSLLGKNIAPGFCMSEIYSINEHQIEDLLTKLQTLTPELVAGIEKYVTRSPKDGEQKRLAMSEAQYYAIKDTLALFKLNLSVDKSGEVVLEKL